MRSKEDAHDYRYFPDPDLPALVIAPAWIDEVRASLPPLPEALRAQFQQRLGLSAYDATTLTASRAMAGYFERVVARLGEIAPAAGDDAARAQAKLAANWVMGDLAAALNRDGVEIDASPVSPHQLALLLARIQDGTVSGKIARDVFGVLWQERPDADDAADQVIASRGLKQISDTGALEKIIDEVLAANPKSVEEFRAGKDKAFNALVGQAMKATRGKANPQQVNELLRARLAG
ncbi:MAG TPA: Asp-tRNA(Asn)/Glu-tRNA(Gln) amidotransferase GatCAB subunit B, partial [Quisquiliibacterium sp.]|nr:Asp-tRNA(Asn)/Glu-tRNA(Gln) amidotransferase GatCAB subunit B [Quisquiliibacterium sp.]